MMSPKAIKLIAYQAMGRVVSEDYVDWAMSEVMDGWESPNLAILAGLCKPLYRPEVEFYFRQTLDDLGWTLPGPEAALRQYARNVAQKIISAAVPPVEGCREIYNVLVALDYALDLQAWLYLDEQLEPDTYADLQDAQLDAVIISEAKVLLENREDQS